MTYSLAYHEENILKTQYKAWSSPVYAFIQFIPSKDMKWEPLALGQTPVPVFNTVATDQSESHS